MAEIRRRCADGGGELRGMAVEHNTARGGATDWMDKNVGSELKDLPFVLNLVGINWWWHIYLIAIVVHFSMSLTFSVFHHLRLVAVSRCCDGLYCFVSPTICVSGCVREWILRTDFTQRKTDFMLTVIHVGVCFIRAKTHESMRTYWVAHVRLGRQGRSQSDRCHAVH